MSQPQPTQGGYFNTGGTHLDSSVQGPKLDALRSAPGFSPFEEPNRTFEEHGDQGNYPTPDINRRVPTDRSPFPPASEPGSYFDSSYDPNGAGYATGKGSRFAKFFDGKGRDGLGALPMGKSQTPVGFVSSSPNPGQRQDQGHFNGASDHRAMDDIFAMLSGSSQVSHMSTFSSARHPESDYNV